MCHKLQHREVVKTTPKEYLAAITEGSADIPRIYASIRRANTVSFVYDAYL